MVEKLPQLNSSDMGGEKWNETVKSYFEAADITNEEVNFPAIMRGLGEIQGQTILDYGCGNGRFARRIEQMGATNVIGVDLAPAMIDLAKTIDSNSRVEYYANLDNTLSFLADNSIDKVMANLVFMMSPTKEDMQQAFREIHRVLKEGGVFVYLVTHPAFIERGAHDYRNEFDGQFDYFKEGKPYRFVLIDSQGREIDEKFYDHHYTLATYLNTAIQSGFTIAGIEEVSYNDPAVVEKYKIPHEFQTYPQSLMVVGEKLITPKSHA